MSLVPDPLLSELECRVCLAPCHPPIYMCRNGHNLCSACQPQHLACPECRVRGRPDFRNTHAEQVSHLLRGRCRYEQHGCSTFVLKHEVVDHDRNCPFRFQCGVCKLYRGDVQGLKFHLSRIHRELYSEGDTWMGFVPNRPRTSRYLFCHSAGFQCGFTRSHRGLTLFARYLGPREKAADWKCAVEFLAEDDASSGCKCVVECVSTHDSGSGKSVLVTLHELQDFVAEYGSAMCSISILPKGG